MEEHDNLRRLTLPLFFDRKYLRRQIEMRSPAMSVPRVLEDGDDAEVQEAFLGESGGWRVPASPLFDTIFYLERNPDVAAAGVVPFLHFLGDGLTEGRAFHPEIQLPPVTLTDSEDGTRHLFGDPAKADPVSPILASVRDRFGPLPGIAWQLDLLAALFALADTGSVAKRLMWAFGALIDKDVAALMYPGRDPWDLVRHLVVENPDAELPGIYFGGTVRELLAAVRRLDETADRYWAPGPRLNLWYYETVNADLKSWPHGMIEHYLAYGQFESRVASGLLDPGQYRWAHPEARDMPAMKHLLMAALRGEAVRPNPACPSPLELARIPENGPSVQKALDLLATAYDACLADSGYGAEPSDVFRQIRAAAALDPVIRPVLPRRMLLPKPFDQGLLPAAIACRRDIGRADLLVLRDHISMGGADRVAGKAIRTLSEEGRRIVVISTMRGGVDEAPRHYPDQVPIIDLGAFSEHLNDAQMEELLYDVIVGSGARAVLNVNSRLGWETTLSFGRQLSQATRLFAYAFCDDRDQWGNVAGYPSRYVLPAIDHLAGVIADTGALRRELADRIGGGPAVTDRLHWLRTPMDGDTGPLRVSPPRQLGSDLRIAWAGRFDRQKRFDLVIDIARLMPEAEFLVWGQPVLKDYSYDPATLPANLHLRGLYESFSEIADQSPTAFLYTSAWDGAPTILLDAVAAGLPIIASNVGGVAECLPSGHPYLISGEAGPEAYCDAVRRISQEPAVSEAGYTAVLEARNGAEYATVLKEVVYG